MIKHYLKVEIADSPSQHAKGLMFRKKMGEDEGMLFKFNNSQNLKFWGVNTFIPLSIAFISPDNTIEKISYITPGNATAICSDKDCNMAIEANYDFFRKNNVKEGDEIEVIYDDYNTLIKFVD
jgi:uncharacterized membrane protein (UPF0127 family)